MKMTMNECEIRRQKLGGMSSCLHKTLIRCKPSCVKGCIIWLFYRLQIFLIHLLTACLKGQEIMKNAHHESREPKVSPKNDFTRSAFRNQKVFDLQFIEIKQQRISYKMLAILPHSLCIDQKIVKVTKIFNISSSPLTFNLTRLTIKKMPNIQQIHENAWAFLDS